jgi:hypothetical protein
MIENRASRHRVIDHSTKHLRIGPLNFFHFRRYGFRQIDSQLNGTRIPHTLDLYRLQKLGIFAGENPCIAGFAESLHGHPRVAQKIDVPPGCVKPFRNLKPLHSLRKKYVILQRLTGFCRIVSRPFSWAKKSFWKPRRDQENMPLNDNCRTLHGNRW